MAANRNQRPHPVGGMVYNGLVRRRGRKKQKGLQAIDKPCKPLKLLEAAIGFEPMNNGFADRCLSHLAMPPRETFEKRPLLPNLYACPVECEAYSSGVRHGF